MCFLFAWSSWLVCSWNVLACLGSLVRGRPGMKICGIHKWHELWGMESTASVLFQSYRKPWGLYLEEQREWRRFKGCLPGLLAGISYASTMSVCLSWGLGLRDKSAREVRATWSIGSTRGMDMREGMLHMVFYCSTTDKPEDRVWRNREIPFQFLFPPTCDCNLCQVYIQNQEYNILPCFNEVRLIFKYSN